MGINFSKVPDKKFHCYSWKRGILEKILQFGALKDSKFYNFDDKGNKYFNLNLMKEKHH